MTASTSSSQSPDFYPALWQYLNQCEAGFDAIPADRKRDLEALAKYVAGRLSQSQPAKLTFICTHNSRRSHLSQIWAHIAAVRYGLAGVETYSGGTEATALNPRAVAALRRAGLRVETDNPAAANPRYAIFTADNAAPLVCFSKIYDAPPNPTQAYCAVMTCSQADDACPLVMGCDLRMPLRYEDPKVTDDTPHEAQRYDERSAQICTEMLYLVSHVDRLP